VLFRRKEHIKGFEMMRRQIADQVAEIAYLQARLDDYECDRCLRCRHRHDKIKAPDKPKGE
jgi:hypothetical protein